MLPAEIIPYASMAGQLIIQKLYNFVVRPIYQSPMHHDVPARAGFHHQKYRSHVDRV